MHVRARESTDYGELFVRCLYIKQQKKEFYAKKKLMDWILRCGEFQGVNLEVDYGCTLTGQSDFVRFNALLREACRLYASGVADDEMQRLMVALLNSLFWDYGSPLHRLSKGVFAPSLIDDLCDRIFVEQMVYRHLTLIANHYKHRGHCYSAEKVILQQSLAALADIAHCIGVKRHYTLVAHLLTLELHEWVENISVFECEVQKFTPRLSIVERTLGYLGREHHERRVIATDEYAMMVMEVKEILSSGCLPATIVPLKLQPNGALLSGFSVGFVTYGIYLLYCRHSVVRSVWIEYLCMKISRSKSTIDKKFSLRPDTWVEKIEGD